MLCKSFRYRIYPTKRQERILESSLDGCRILYNKLLFQRKTTWETEKKSLSFFDLCKFVRPLFEEYHTVDVSSYVLGDVAMRVDLAFKAFFRRVKAGQKPGYPRFKSKDRYNSITFRNESFKIIDDQKIKLTKIGDIKLHYHRKLQGKPKTCTIKRTPQANGG